MADFACGSIRPMALRCLMGIGFGFMADFACGSIRPTLYGA
jgi:hypothetical protein